MNASAMSSEDRLRAAIRLEPVDRIPVAPMIYYFAANYAGITQHELWSDWGKYEYAIEKCYADLGPWDIYYNICPLSPLAYQASLMMKVKYPGVDLDENNICQFEEQEFMRPEDYDWILNYAGAESLFHVRYTTRILARFMPKLARQRFREQTAVSMAIVRNMLAWRRHFKWWQKRGVAVLLSTIAEAPFDQFSMTRSLQPFSLDLIDRPEKVKASALRLARPWARTHHLLTLISGVPRVIVALHRSANSFISPEMFAGISLPSLKVICEYLVERGVTPILHCDGNWDRNLKHLRRLPAKKCVIQFDGPTDIFRAKQEIGDMHCIFGDVKAYDLVMAGPAQIDEYCHRLIEELGRGGGFILGAGCEIPPNARPENVKALIQAPKKYAPPKT